MKKETTLRTPDRLTRPKYALPPASLLPTLSLLLLPTAGFCAQWSQQGVAARSANQPSSTQAGFSEHVLTQPPQARRATELCPTPTALSTLVQPGQLLQLENRITHTLQSHRHGLLSDFFARYGKTSKPLSHDMSISVPTQSPTGFRILREDDTAQRQNKSQGYHQQQLAPDLQLYWDDARGSQPVVMVTFAQSEQAGPEPDQLAWTLDIAAVTADQLYVSYQLAPETVIAGTSLATWRGQTATAVKLNPCMQAQMLRLSEAGMAFRQPDGRPSAFAALADTRLTAATRASQHCAVLVYQADRLLYRFDTDLPRC